MLTKLEDAERLLEIAKRLVAEHRKYQRISERARHDFDASTPKARQKATNDLNYQAHHIVRIETEMHAAAVDAGLADLREPSHYAERTWRPTGFHEYPWTPTRPASLKPRAA